MTLSDNIILRKRLSDAESPLSARKQRKTGKRVSLKDRYVFSIQELLDFAREAELQTSNRKVRRPRHKMLQSGKLDSEDEEVIESRSSDDESDSLVLASLRPFRT